MFMKPSKEDLERFNGNLREVADFYDISERTARRWMQGYDLFKPQENYGACKLSFQQAKEIRVRHTNESMSIKDLAKDYDVTFSAISRILHNFTYRDPDTAKVHVTYNPKEV